MPDLSHDTIADVPVEQLIRTADYFRHLPDPALAFDALRCDPVACEVDSPCAACLTKLEIVAVIEAAEKGSECITSAHTFGNTSTA